MGDDAVNRRFTGVFLACIAAAVICLFATMPPLWQKSMPQDGTPYFSDGEDLIDINTAPAAELRCLPGIGEKKAQAIIEYRTQNGPFSSAEELCAVEGISMRTVEKFLNLICFS